MTRSTVPPAEALRIARSVEDAARLGVCTSIHLAHLCRRPPVPLRVRAERLAEIERSVRHAG